MNTDKIGGWVSSACAVHCIVMPLVLTSLPLIGLGFLADHWFETCVLIVAVLMACVSAVRGHKKHGKWRVTVLFVCAVVVMGIAHALHDHHDCDEHIFNNFLMPLGGLLAAAGHVWNLHHLKEADCACEGHELEHERVTWSHSHHLEGSSDASCKDCEGGTGEGGEEGS